MEDNKVEITFDDESGSSAAAENKVLTQLANLNYDRVTKDAVIGVVRDSTTEDGYRLKLTDNMSSPEYLKEIPGYNKITQAISQTRKTTDILPNGVSVMDYENSVCSAKFLYESLLEQKKRLYIYYDRDADNVVITKDMCDNYVELSFTDRDIFDLQFSSVEESTTNILFKIFTENNIEKITPVNSFYYILEECYLKGNNKTKLNVTNPHILKGNDVSFALVLIKSISGEQNQELANKLVQAIETGRLTLYSIQYALQEILYSLTIENTPDVPQLYLTNDNNGDLVWRDFNSLTLHSDGISIKKKNVFFREMPDYGNSDYVLISGFDFDNKEDLVEVVFSNINSYDENAIILIGDNQFIPRYSTKYDEINKSLTFYIKLAEFFNEPEDGVIVFTLIILTSGEVEKNDFIKNYITKKEALELFNGERLNISGFVTDEKLDKILREHRYETVLDQDGEVKTVDVQLRYGFDSDIYLAKDIVANNSNIPGLKPVYKKGDSIRKLLTDIINPYTDARTITLENIIPKNIVYTLYKEDSNGDFYPVDNNTLYYDDDDRIFISFKPVNTKGLPCEYIAGNIKVSLVSNHISFSDTSSVSYYKEDKFYLNDTSKKIHVNIDYGLPEMLIDSYGELVPTTNVFETTIGSISDDIIVTYEYPKIMTLSVPFNSDIEYNNIVMDLTPNNNKYDNESVVVEINNSKYLFIAVREDFYLDSIIHKESNNDITDSFDITESIIATNRSENYTIYEYKFNREDISLSLQINIKECEGVAINE